jgi:RHS repeat-associated protein
VARYHLDAWGNFRSPTELDASRNRFAFTGYLWDEETSVYYAKARFYDPEFGRFTTQDSFLGRVDDPPSLHRYLYANANPGRFIDPTGHASWSLKELRQKADQALLGVATFGQHFQAEAGRAYDRAVEGIGNLLIPGRTARERAEAGQDPGVFGSQQLKLLEAAGNSQSKPTDRLVAFSEALKMQPAVIVEETILRPAKEAPGRAREMGVHLAQAEAATSSVEKAVHYLEAANAGSDAFTGFAAAASAASVRRGAATSVEDVLATRGPVRVAAGETSTSQTAAAATSTLPRPTAGFERYATAEQQITQVPFTLAEAEDALRMNAAMADLRSQAAAVPRTHGRFGTHAHKEFEASNASLNQATQAGGSPLALGPEEFRLSSPISGGAGPVVPRRASGSRGVDVMVYVNGIPVRGFDLKTGRPWTASELKDLERRFGVTITQIQTR